MHAYGSDRLREDRGRYILLSRHPKGWKGRVAKTLTNAEHPGTAVLWEEQYFEVVSVQDTPGGIRYVLEPWKETHAIRQLDRYDEENETALANDRRAVAVQASHRRAANLAGLLTGHLPGPVQTHLGNELGVVPTRLTLVSLLGPLALLGVCAYLHVDAKMAERPSPVPLLVWMLVQYLMLDAVIRFFVVMTQSRPMGSALGFLAYTAYYYIVRDRSRLIPPLAGGRGDRLFTLPPPDDVALRDEVEMRGALLSLLTPAEQQRVAERCGYDYRQHAKGVAWLILIGSAVGVIASLAKLQSGNVTLGALVSIVLGGALIVEQVKRLRAFERGPAGSMLAFLVRPFLRRLLSR